MSGALTQYRPGDVALSRSTGIGGWLIRVGTTSRYNHARLIVSEEGDVVESVAGGVIRAKVQYGDVVVSPWDLTDEQRAKIPAVGESLVGTPYAWVDLVFIALAQMGIVLPGMRKRIERPDRLFCSQLVDYAWYLVGYHAFDDGRMSQNVSPGDIANLAMRNGWRAKIVATVPALYRLKHTSDGGGSKVKG